ncbi:MAG: hypothetical protein HBSIN02_15170 [Bacteroidia bacterium]|nr:MAG: hypothetical protein HBSIN02_15170 [Bacteroidia bacterium]
MLFGIVLGNIDNGEQLNTVSHDDPMFLFDVMLTDKEGILSEDRDKDDAEKEKDRK